jgi:hypothetical protein
MMSACCNFHFPKMIMTAGCDPALRVAQKCLFQIEDDDFVLAHLEPY